MLRLSLQLLLFLSLAAATILVGNHTLVLLINPISHVVASGQWRPERARTLASLPQDDHGGDGYSASLTRPIFFEGRQFPKPAPLIAKPKPPPRPQRQQAPAAAPRMNLKLVGIIMREETPRALLGAATSLPNWYGVGEKIDGWTLAKITNDSVVLTLNGREEVLSLYHHKESN